MTFMELQRVDNVSKAVRLLLCKRLTHGQINS